MDNLCHLTLSPISKDIKSPSYIDYNEQLSRVLHEGFQWCWDDSRYNKAKVGEYFAFYFHGMRVVIHQILDVKPPSERLPSWSKNVGQGDRNVLALSHPMLEITWIEWQLMSGPESKMGTYTTTDLSYTSPRLYEYLRSALEPIKKFDTNTNKNANVKLIIEEESDIDEIESEERNLLLRLEQLQKMKKINHLQGEKNDLIEQVKSLTTLIGNIDKLIEELKQN
jgi:hypothetical protein